MLIAQITDTHVKTEGKLAYRQVDTAANLARCVEHLLQLEPKPDVVLITGDLTDFGEPDEYRLLRRLIAPLQCPVHVIPGNHDDRENLRRAFSDHAYLPSDGEFLHYAVEDFPVRLIGLDTTIPGAPGGTLCARRLQWLDRTLAQAPEHPTALFMHHPPFRTGIDHMDVQNCDAGEALGALIESHPQVIRVMCGHVHRPIQLLWHGVTASIAPSPSHNVALDLRENAPPRFFIEPAACQLHQWREDTGLISHLSFIGEFAGPYPFFDEHGKLID